MQATMPGQLPLLSTPQQAVQWLRRVAPPHASLHGDSRRVQRGDIFCAWPGAAADGRAHVHAALAAGAAAVLVEAHHGAERFDLPAAAPVAAVPQLKAASGPIANLWLGQPSADLAVLAVTGTNGKTSTAWWLAHALAAWGRKEGQRGCAFAGTLGLGVPPALTAGADTLTTPEALRLQTALRQWVDAGLAACALEASSIGLAEQRLAGTHIHTALFTNFTQDHLDYHAHMAAYWQAKAALFAWPQLQTAIVNIDDAHGARLHHTLQTQPLDVWSTSIQHPARLRAVDIAPGRTGLDFTLVEAGQARVRMHTALIGSYNVRNLLGVLAALRSLGQGLAQAAATCRQLPAVPGRMQTVAGPGDGSAPHQPLVIVDYAHTPDALQQALCALRPLARQRGGALHCVFGCGGGRDAAKRPRMGQAAQRHADHITLTSDNPRGEAPGRIMAEIRAGLPPGTPVREEPDRARAIAQTIAAANPHDVILIAGKGHETSQEVAGQRLPFSDVQQARAALERRAG